MRKLYATKLLNRPEVKFYLVLDYTLLSRWPKSTQAEIQSDGGSLGLVITLKNRSRLSHYWDTCGSPFIKCLCFFVVFFFFFFLRHKMEKLRNSTQWSLGSQHHDNQLWSNEVFICWSRVLSWWWVTLSSTDRAGSHDEPRDFCV